MLVLSILKRGVENGFSRDLRCCNRRKSSCGGAVYKEGLEEGKRPADLIQKGLIAGMAVVGEGFKKNEFYVPEVLIAAGLQIFEPLLTEHELEPVATLVIGTVEGDLHDIGKNFVAMMFEGAGFRVIDLGVDVKPQQFVERQ